MLQRTTIEPSEYRFCVECKYWEWDPAVSRLPEAARCAIKKTDTEASDTCGRFRSWWQEPRKQKRLD